MDITYPDIRPTLLILARQEFLSTPAPGHPDPATSRQWHAINCVSNALQKFSREQIEHAARLEGCVVTNGATAVLAVKMPVVMELFNEPQHDDGFDEWLASRGPTDDERAAEEEYFRQYQRGEDYADFIANADAEFRAEVEEELMYEEAR